jgi:hypothetical protein
MSRLDSVPCEGKRFSGGGNREKRGGIGGRKRKLEKQQWA